MKRENGGGGGFLPKRTKRKGGIPSKESTGKNINKMFDFNGESVGSGGKVGKSGRKKKGKRGGGGLLLNRTIMKVSNSSKRSTSIKYLN